MPSARKIPGLDQDAGSLGYGTWLMNGFNWSDSEDRCVESALEKSIEQGIFLIDTAPVYGFGRCEESIGRRIKQLGVRSEVLLATKFGLEWSSDFKTIRRNGSKRHLMLDLDKSRRRLQSDVIDLYQIHWPDPATPIGETMDALLRFYDAGIIRAIGVSNFSKDEMLQAMRYAPIHAAQFPFNLFEQKASIELIPFCQEKGIAVLTYSPLCRGLLGGKYGEGDTFQPGDIRASDSKFSMDRFKKYQPLIWELNEFAGYKKCLLPQLSLAWASQFNGVTMALAGARTADQALMNAQARSVQLTSDDFDTLRGIIEKHLPEAFTSEPTKPAF